MNFLRTIQYRIIQARQNRLFMRFNGPLRGIRLSITSAGRDSESGAAFISLHPLVALDQPEILLSYVKARLFSLMPSAVAPLVGSPQLRKHSLLEETPFETYINRDGRKYPEPLWHVECGNRFGPFGFRYGFWREESGEFIFSLVRVRDGFLNCPPEVIEAYMRVAERLLCSYRDNIRHIDI